MVRISQVAPAQGTNAIADKIRVRRGARGLTPLDQTLLNAPEIADGWNSLLGAVRTKNSLPGDVRELMVLRVAARNFAAFEWIHHEHVGRDEGLTFAQLGVIRDLVSPIPSPENPHPLTPLQAAALKYADVMTSDVKVPGSVIDALKSHLKNDQQLMEATATVATYNMVSRLLLALDVGDLSDQYVPLPGVESKEHVVEVETAVKLRARVHKRADGDAPWLILINSLLTDLSMWDYVVPTLARKYNIVLYDSRGHGQSSVPSEACTLERLADDVPALLSALSIPTPVHAVIGVSQGGATALAVAQRHSTIFDRLIACDTQATSPAANSKAWDDRIELAQKSGMSALADVTTPRWFAPGTPCAPGGQSNGMIKAMIEGTSVKGFERAARSLQGYDVAPGLGKALAGKKVLLLSGQNDGKLPEVLKGVKESLEKEVDVSHAVIPAGGHLPMCDQPAAWLETVLPFLA